MPTLKSVMCHIITGLSLSIIIACNVFYFHPQTRHQSRQFLKLLSRKNPETHATEPQNIITHHPDMNPGQLNSRKKFVEYFEPPPPIYQSTQEKQIVHRCRFSEIHVRYYKLYFLFNWAIKLIHKSRGGTMITGRENLIVAESFRSSIELRYVPISHFQFFFCK